MKKLIAISIAVLMLSGIVSVTSAHADRKTMEGFLLGTGVAIIGSAIIHEINKDARADYDRYTTVRHRRPEYEPYRHDKYRHHKKDRYYKKNRHHKRYARHQRGHWEVEKTWVEPIFKEKWNPGHYNRRGKWVGGRYERFVVQEGYWSQKKVWVWH